MYVTGSRPSSDRPRRWLRAGMAASMRMPAT